MYSERWRWVLLLTAMLTILLATLIPREAESQKVQPEFPKTVVEQPRIVPEAPPAPKNDNVALGKQIAKENGVEGEQWECLYQLGMRESGWNHEATNPTSGAYGIPQSLPANKMASHGDIDDPQVQIRWFLDYVESRYGTACNALQFQITNNWY